MPKDTVRWKADHMKRPKPLESLILTIRGHRVMIDADLANLYGVETRTLNQAVKRNANRFPKAFMFRLTDQEKSEVITNCDHLRRLKFAQSLPFAFTEHGAIMAANRTILKRLAEIDKTLLEQDTALVDLYEKLQPLLQPPPDGPKRRIGFQSKGKS